MDNKQQLPRWVEHLSELFAQTRPIRSEAIAGTPFLPLSQDLDNLQTTGKLRAVIKASPSGKSPGIGCITANRLKCDDSLVPVLSNILRECFNEGCLPQISLVFWKKWETPRFWLDTKAKVNKAIAKTTEEKHFYLLPGRSLPGSHYIACKPLQKGPIKGVPTWGVRPTGGGQFDF